MTAGETTLFVDRGERAQHRFRPGQPATVRRERWRGACAETTTPDGIQHVFADSADLFAPGGVPLPRATAELVHAVLDGPEFTLGPRQEQPPAAETGEPDRAQALAELAALAEQLGVELELATYRQQVAVGPADALVPDHRALTTIEVSHPEDPDCREVVRWRPAVEEALAEAAERVRALAALPAQPLPDLPPPAGPGALNVVLDAGQAGPLFHELVGHPLEADVVAGRSSYLAGTLGTRVAPDWLWVSDGPPPAGEGLVPGVDDEGTPVTGADLIAAGLVAAVLADRHTDPAAPSSGHARRVDYRHPVIPRMWHTTARAVGVAAEEPPGPRLHPRGLQLRWMNLLTGQAEFSARTALLDTGEADPIRIGPLRLSGNGRDILAALRPGAGAARSAGRASKGCGKLGQYPLVTTFANGGLWLPTAVLDVLPDLVP